MCVHAYRIYTYIYMPYMYIFVCVCAENIKIKFIVPVESLCSIRDKFKRKNWEVQMIGLKRISDFRNQDERGLETNNKEESPDALEAKFTDSCFKKMKSSVVSNDAFQ